MKPVFGLHHEPKFWELQITLFGVRFILAYRYAHWRNVLTILPRKTSR
jgi:hypothetical protein